MPKFTDEADFAIRFQPFTLYPDLPKGDNHGVDKVEYFKALQTSRNGGVPLDPAESDGQFKSWYHSRSTSWKAEGLYLAPRAGKWGQSFDAQRLISFARKQGREHEMVEEIYGGNHSQNQPLSEWSFLIAAAEKAGVTGVEKMLMSDQEVAEVKAKIQQYVDMGINAVPVLVINDREVIHGAPEPELLESVFAQEIARNSAM